MARVVPRCIRKIPYKLYTKGGILFEIIPSLTKNKQV